MEREITLFKKEKTEIILALQSTIEHLQRNLDLERKRNKELQARQQSNSVTEQQEKPGETWAKVTKNLSNTEQGWQYGGHGKHARTSRNYGMNKRTMTEVERNKYEALYDRDLNEVIPGRQLAHETRNATVRQYSGAVPKERKKLSKDEMDRMAKGLTRRNTVPMCFLHFSGIKKARFADIKDFLYTAGIKMGTLRNISFIGNSILELISFITEKEEIAQKLEAAGLKYERDFNMRSPDNVKSEWNVEASHTMEKRMELSEELRVRRLNRIYSKISDEPRNHRLKNFLSMVIETGETGGWDWNKNTTEKKPTSQMDVEPEKDEESCGSQRELDETE